MLKKPTRLSVNINKIATLRNARGGDIPNVCLAAKYCQEFGAQGITVHPRPDERHIRYSDAKALREVVKTEYNIEGYPNKSFIDLVIECKPDQVTLVPDSPDVLTSNSGWDTISNYDFGSTLVFEEGSTTYTSIIYDPDSGKNVIAFVDAGDSNKGKAIVINTFNPVSLTSENFIGFAHAAYADGQKATVKTTGSIARNNIQAASTSSTLGDKTVISASYAGDGNVSAESVAFDSTNNRVVIHYRDTSSGNAAGGLTRALNYVAVGTVSGNSISFGTSVWMRSGTDDAIYQALARYDSNSNRVVLLYNHASRGYAKVGTVDSSDNSISLGSETEFRDDYASHITSCFDSSNNKIVIAFRDGGNSNYGTAIVGTVDPSDNSITFGSRVVFESADTFDSAISFDSSNNKVVIAYQDRGNSNYGTAIVGTVSGTGISFGSPVVFESAAIGRTIGNTFDSSNNKIVLVYEDDANSDYGTAIVGTVSGTSISFGTAAVFESAAIAKPNCVFSSAGNTIVIAYRDEGDSGKGKFLEGTVSGTGISFGSPTEFDSGDIDEPTALSYDSQNNKVVMAYGDYENSIISTARVIAPTGALGDLTIGQQYFVQTDGTLGTSADDPSVIAGTAIGASDIIVKG